MSTCKARRYQDEWQCGTCGLCWDVKEENPPKCLTNHDRHLRAMAELWADEPEVESVTKSQSVHGPRC